MEIYQALSWYPDLLFVMDPSLQQQAYALTSSVFDVYRRLYPEFMANKDFPHIAVVSGNFRAAATHSVVENGVLRAILFIPDGLLRSRRPELQAGILAHEMAHALLGHSRDHLVYYATDRNTREPVTGKRLQALRRVIELAQTAGPSRFAGIRNSVEKFRLEEVEWSGVEDEADQFAITILKNMGLSAEEFARVSLDRKCEKRIRKGKSVSFGSLFLTHHGDCYRVKKFLEMGADQDFSVAP